MNGNCFYNSVLTQIVRTVGFSNYTAMTMRRDLCSWAYDNRQTLMDDKQFTELMESDNYSLWDFIEQHATPYAWVTLAMVRLAALKFHVNIQVRKKMLYKK